MSISYEWKVWDMQWDQSSGMILQVEGLFVGTQTVTVGSATSTFSHSIRKRTNLIPTTNPIPIENVTPDDVRSWLNVIYAGEIEIMKKEIYDKIISESKSYLEENIIEEYIKKGQTLALGGNMKYNPNRPNDSWNYGAGNN